MPFVYSTLTNTNAFILYANTNAHSLGVALQRIEIKGGHGMKNPKGLDTPRGVVTQITDEELEILKKDYSFMQHVKDGWITFDDKKIDPEKKADNMADKDGSAPLTPKDFITSDHSTEEAKIYKKKKDKAA
jgi:hypothetical protein